MIQVFKHIFLILSKEERKKYYSLTAINTIISIVDVLSLALLLIIIACYSEGNDQMPRFLQNYAISQKSTIPIFLFFILFTIKNIAAYLSLHYQYKFAYGVASRLSSDNLSNYLNGDHSEFINTPQAAHIRRISDHPTNFAQHILIDSQLLLTEFSLIILTVAGIIFFNAQIFLLLLIIMLPPVFITAYFTKEKLKKAKMHLKQSSENLLQYLTESLNGYIESNIYNKNAVFTNRFHKQQKKFNHYLSDVQISQGMPLRLIEIFAVFGLLALIILNKNFNTGTSNLINIGAFTIAAYKLIPGIVRISNISSQIKAHDLSTQSLLPKLSVKVSGKHSLVAPIDSIQFKQVFFSHKSHTILKDFNFHISAGDFVGIVGPSGKGKTTLVQLLLGFLEPETGSISINGIKVPDVEKLSYWHQIAYVKQSPFIIHDTILNNIIFFESDYDEQRLFNAIKIAGLEGFISSSHHGLSRIITDNGKNISGGQRQRLEIARALYKNANLIILDEPCSELDSRSEKQLLEHLKSLSDQGKTIVLITHNEQSLAYCNKTILLNEETTITDQLTA